MPRKKKEEELSKNPFRELKRETVRGMLAVLFFVLALFLVLSRFGSAGVVGDFTYSGLSKLVGVGYYLLPILLVVLIISLFKDDEERKLGALKTIGALVFLFSGLALIELVFDERGGILGSLLAGPLVMLVDTYAAFLILTGLVLASILLIFDTHLNTHLAALNPFRKREEELDEFAEENLPEIDEPLEEAEEDDAEEPEEDEEADEEEEPEEKPSRIKNMLGLGKKEPEGLVVADVLGEYTPPPVSLLEKDRGKASVGDTKANANIIKRTLMNFGIQVEMDEISVGPTVTRYALKPAEGVRISKIVSLQSNLELALAASPIRIEAPIPGKSLVGIEVPNSTKSTIGLSRLLGSEEFTESPKSLLVSLGRDITGVPHYADIAKMPHLLVAGATGSGKSVTVNALITSLLYRNGPQNLRFIMVDPKRVELTLYNGIPHLLTPVITQPKQAILALKWAANEMDRRYNILETERVRDIGSYHQNILAPAMKEYERKVRKNGGTAPEDTDLPETMPYIVVIIDELADIMQAYPRELEAGIVKLAQMSRAVGIHLILSTQRPSVNVITGLIKANIPARIALQVSSQIDSRTILDTGGAEKLLGAGDMLFLSGEMSKPHRIQSPYLSEQEVKKIVTFLTKHNDYGIDTGIDLAGAEQSGNGIFAGSLDDDEDSDPKYDEAKQVVIEAGKASTSYLQRKLGIGYSRAAKIMDILEERGVIGPQEGSKPRDVLIAPGEEIEERDESYEDEGEEEAYESDSFTDDEGESDDDGEEYNEEDEEDYEEDEENKRR